MGLNLVASSRSLAGLLIGASLSLAICSLSLAPQKPDLAGSEIPAGETGPFDALGEFAFQTKDGATIRHKDLVGKVWVVGCFFTCCTESCPKLSASMAKLQEQFRDEPDVRLVSLTVDPSNDSPQKLSQYAENYRASADRWIFLTGSQDTVNNFVRNQLHLGVEANPSGDIDPGNRVLHSPKLTLIDRQGIIQGYFDGTDLQAVERLRNAVVRLTREK